MGVSVTAGVLVAFTLLGPWLLGALSVSLEAFRIAGGVLRFLVAIDMLFALLVSSALLRLLGVTGTNVVTRVLGMLLAALAVQLVIDGVRQAIG